MYKVGDRVVNGCSGYNLDDGSGVTTGVVTSIESDGDVMVLFDGLKKSLFCYENEVIAEESIGKTLTELDVKPGDVVRLEKVGVDGGWTYPVQGNQETIYTDGSWFSVPKEYHDELNGLFSVVSRAPEPIKPQRMHPDDVAEAMMQYAHDCGYVTEVIKIRSENGSYVYDI